jgi:apolipoprotein N-acyltransferase
VIDPTGKIINQTELFEEASLQGTVKFTHDNTFYMLYGDVFVYSCLLSIGICILISIRRRRYAGRNTRND